MRATLLFIVLLIINQSDACSKRHKHRKNGPFIPPGRSGYGTHTHGCPCVPLGDCPAVVRALHVSTLDLNSLGHALCDGADHKEPRLHCCLVNDTLSSTSTPHPHLNVGTSVTKGIGVECGVCGESPLDQRIVGGNEAAIGQFPWIVRLGYIRGEDDLDVENALFQCGGSLISPWHVVTAAHCVLRAHSAPKLRWVRLGEHDERTINDCNLDGQCAPLPQDRRVTSWRTHPGYQTKRGFQHDIAVIKLDKPVKYTTWVRPICLPPQAHNVTGQRAVVAGWGTTRPGATSGSPVLRSLWKTIMDLKNCSRLYSGVANVTSGQLCAGGVIGEDSCAGDSGGPLAMPMPVRTPDQGDMRFALLGVVSFGARLCGTNGLPGVYVHTPYYMDWITEAIRELGGEVN